MKKLPQQNIIGHMKFTGLRQLHVEELERGKGSTHKSLRKRVFELFQVGTAQKLDLSDNSGAANLHEDQSIGKMREA